MDREKPDIWEDETPPLPCCGKGTEMECKGRAAIQQQCSLWGDQVLLPGPRFSMRVIQCSFKGCLAWVITSGRRKDATGTPNVSRREVPKREYLKHPKRGRSGCPGHHSSPFPREPPIHHSQNFPSSAKQASSITLPGTKVFLMLSSIASHNDSLAGVPGCPPLP